MRKAQREEADNALDELKAADTEYEWLIREANLPEHPDEDDDERPDADFHSTGADSRRRSTCGTLVMDSLKLRCTFVDKW